MHPPAVDRFIEASRTFCEFIEARNWIASRDAASIVAPEVFLRDIQPKLAELYAAGLALPVVPYEGDGDLVEEMSEADWKTLRDSLVGVILDYLFYWTARGFVASEDAREEDDATLTGDLSDDLADIYRDVRAGLDAWDVGEPEARREALWFWRLRFTSHFGQHLVEAMKAIHELVAQRM